MLKKIGIGLGVVLVAIIGVSWYVFSNLDSYVKDAIETYASEATQTPVRVGAVNISLTTGEGTITGVSIDNPSGYSSAKAVTIGTVHVRVDTDSLRGTGPILVKEISVDKPQVSYELNGTTGNLQVIQKNATAYASQFKGGEARKQIIEDLTIKDGQVSATAAQLQGKNLKLPLPAIHLRDIGKSTGGATAGQVAGQVVSAITQEAQKVAAGALQRQITSVIGREAGDAAPGGFDTGGVANQVKGLLGK